MLQYKKQIKGCFIVLYIDSIVFPDAEREFVFFLGQKRTCYTTYYPFQIFSAKHFERIDFEPITILCGGNGCGKTTALNVIAEKLNLTRESMFNKSNFYEDYLSLCKINLASPIPQSSKIITSDDVFDYMLNIRTLNEGIDLKREALFDDYLDAKYNKFTLKSLDDYEALKKTNDARRNTQSKFVRNQLINNIRERSNGESAFMYFTQKIEEDGLYVLDEPENSLAPQLQVDLIQFIQDSVRFFNCQFIISTHSPFFLSLKNAKIYDLDSTPVDIKSWTELESVRSYYDFFISHQKDFEEEQF